MKQLVLSALIILTVFLALPAYSQEQAETEQPDEEAQPFPEATTPAPDIEIIDSLVGDVVSVDAAKLTAVVKIVTDAKKSTTEDMVILTNAGTEITKNETNVGIAALNPGDKIFAEGRTDEEGNFTATTVIVVSE